MDFRDWFGFMLFITFLFLTIVFLLGILFPRDAKGKEFAKHYALVSFITLLAFPFNSPLPPLLAFFIMLRRRINE